MSVPSIDADFKSEERYAKISLAYSNDEQYKEINNAIEEAHMDLDLDINIYETDISNGRKVVVIEYHDDYDRKCGDVFENMMKILKIDHCV